MASASVDRTDKTVEIDMEPSVSDRCTRAMLELSACSFGCIVAGMKLFVQ